MTVTTPQQRATAYAEAPVGDALTRSIRAPDQSTVQWDDALASRTDTAADGTVTTTYFEPDPAFGAQSPVPNEIDIATPGGRTLTVYPQRTKQLANIDDALSVQAWDELVTVNDRNYESAYDRASNALKSTTPEGRTTTTTFDTKGRATDVTAPSLATVHYDYDDAGHVTRVTRSAGNEKRIESFSYGADGFLATSTDALRHVTSFDRDGGGRLTQVTLPDKNTVQIGLDANDNVLSITPPTSEPHAFAYNDANLLTSATPPLVEGVTSPTLTVGGVSYQYDTDFSVSEIDRSDGRNIAFDYDASGRLAHVVLNGAKLAYDYDDAGVLTSVDRSDSVRVQLKHDGPLWTSTEWSGAIKGSVKADYDENLWLASLTVNDASTVQFSYDKDGLVTGASGASADLELTRDTSTGMVTASTLGTVTTATTYNPFGESTALSATFQDGGFSENIDRDALGRVTHITESIGDASHDLQYSYDDVGRLSEVNRDGSVTDYEYDANGNRVRVTVDGAETARGTYDAQDRLQAYGTVTFEQSAQGDLVRKTDGASTLELTYDELGNLEKAVVSDGTSTKSLRYSVDGFGRRVAKNDNGRVTAWLYRDSLRPISEVDPDGTFMHFVYTSDDSAPDFILRSGVPYRVIKDHVGSVRLVINATTGVVDQELDYDDFGNVLGDTNPGFQPFGFAGGLYDPDTGLVRFGARDYDASTGRWTNKDPKGFGGGSTNLYAYCGGDPINLTDPNGLEPIGEKVRKWLLYADYPGSWVVQTSTGDKVLAAGQWTAAGAATMASLGLVAEGVAAAEGYLYARMALLGRVGLVAGVGVGGPVAAGETTALARVELNIGKHAADQMAQRGITETMVETALAKGTPFIDPKNGTVNFVLKEAFASGKSLLVGTNPLTGKITTVIRGTDLISPRFISHRDSFRMHLGKRMSTLEQLLHLLRTALHEPLHKKENIARFQAIVWEGLDPSVPANVRDVLRDLAYDLDFFEPRSEIRNEDQALYGSERVEREIRNALEKLQAAGVNTFSTD